MKMSAFTSQSPNQPKTFVSQKHHEPERSPRPAKENTKYGLYMSGEIAKGIMSARDKSNPGSKSPIRSSIKGESESHSPFSTRKSTINSQEASTMGNSRVSEEELREASDSLKALKLKMKNLNMKTERGKTERTSTLNNDTENGKLARSPVIEKNLIPKHKENSPDGWKQKSLNSATDRGNKDQKTFKSAVGSYSPLKYEQKPLKEVSEVITRNGGIQNRVTTTPKNENQEKVTPSMQDLEPTEVVPPQNPPKSPLSSRREEIRNKFLPKEDFGYKRDEVNLKDEENSKIKSQSLFGNYELDDSPNSLFSQAPKGIFKITSETPESQMPKDFQVRLRPVQEQGEKSPVAENKSQSPFKPNLQRGAFSMATFKPKSVAAPVSVTDIKEEKKPEVKAKADIIEAKPKSVAAPVSVKEVKEGIETKEVREEKKPEAKIKTDPLEAKSKSVVVSVPVKEAKEIKEEKKSEAKTRTDHNEVKPKNVITSVFIKEDKMAEANVTADPFDPEQEIPEEVEALLECPEGCGRKFSARVLPKHAKACVKVFQTKRKQFDTAMHRRIEDQEAPALKKTPTKPNKKKTLSVTKTSEKKAKWKQESEAFRANLKASRGETLSKEEEASRANNDGLIQCEHCLRRFNEKAAEKHIAFCKNKQKAESMKRNSKSISKKV